MHNYFATSNPFNLPAPPNWWLVRLNDFDSMLVVFPSTLRPAHILARRQQFAQPTAPLQALDKHLRRLTSGGDGDIMADRNLVYVESIAGSGAWTIQIFLDLAARDIWAAGGAEAFNDRIITLEQAAADKQQRQLTDDMDHRARDAWRSLKARTGQRTRVTLIPR